MTKTERRERMPICAAFIDELIAAFGRDQVSVLYAEENGLRIGEEKELSTDRVRAER